MTPLFAAEIGYLKKDISVPTDIDKSSLKVNQPIKKFESFIYSFLATSQYFICGRATNVLHVVMHFGKHHRRVQCGDHCEMISCSSDDGIKNLPKLSNLIQVLLRLPSGPSFPQQFDQSAGGLKRIHGDLNDIFDGVGARSESDVLSVTHLLVAARPIIRTFRPMLHSQDHKRAKNCRNRANRLNPSGPVRYLQPLPSVDFEKRFDTLYCNEQKGCPKRRKRSWFQEIHACFYLLSKRHLSMITRSPTLCIYCSRRADEAHERGCPMENPMPSPKTKGVPGNTSAAYVAGRALFARGPMNHEQLFAIGGFGTTAGAQLANLKKAVDFGWLTELSPTMVGLSEKAQHYYAGTEPAPKEMGSLATPRENVHAMAPLSRKHYLNVKGPRADAWDTSTRAIPSHHAKVTP